MRAMPYEDVVYKRDELYEKVWSKPVRKVATEYGCSDVALAKMCRRLGVPLPGRGYWARVTAGQKLKRLRLPTLKKDQPSEIHVRRWKGRAERTMTDEVKERLAKERAAEAPIVVPDALPAEPHELVALTLKVLGKQKPKPGPLLDRGERRCLSTLVAPSSLDRALRIVEAVLSALDARGLSVEATKPAPARLDRHGRLEQSAVAGMTRVQIGEEWVPFQLVEQTAPESPPMKRPEWSKAKPEEMTAWYNRGPTKFIATGKLTLQVDVEPIPPPPSSRVQRRPETARRGLPQRLHSHADLGRRGAAPRTHSTSRAGATIARRRMSSDAGSRNSAGMSSSARSRRSPRSYRAGDSRATSASTSPTCTGSLPTATAS